MNRTNLVEWILPPLGLLWLLPLAIAWGHRRNRARFLVAFSFIGLYLTATPLVSRTLLGSLAVKSESVVNETATLSARTAILVLGGDTRDIAGGGTALGPLSAARVRYAVHLARQTGLPIAVTGGRLRDDEPPVARLMEMSLREDYAIVPVLVEDESRDTCGNLQRSAPLLRQAGFEHVLLVTQAWHAQRGLLAAERAALSATAATPPVEALPRSWGERLLPHTRNWPDTFYALHEWLGLLAYRAGLCR